ncbi:MAG: hypothetical protein ABIY70_21040 [Capsulimonas sp.]|uniref:hypothetical protein n=1 Tax=Capsulimonas sp. TaxID=2494211 RepID=UPI0032675F87
MLNTLLLLHALNSSPARCSDNIRRVTHVVHTRHAREPHVWKDLKVRAIPEPGDSGLTAGEILSWQGRRGRLEQRVKFPKCIEEDPDPEMPPGWWLTQEPIAARQPEAFLCFDGPYPLLVFVAGRASGVYDVQSPLIYALSHDRWKLLNPDPRVTEFTNRGSFYIRGNRLYVFDYGMEEGYSHGAAQHYWLETFIIKNDRLLKQHSRMTYHRYKTWEGPDPLREFGLRWRDWGEGREGIKISGDRN